MMNAIPKCCVIIVKADAKKDSKNNGKLLDIKKAPDTCKIQLKKEIVDCVNRGEDLKSES